MPELECQGCRALQGRVAELEALVRELQARLGIKATNSSLPPSANPPEAPKPVVKKPTGRQPGGQPGHPGPLRQRWPADPLKETSHFVPDVCAHCQVPLAAEPTADDPEVIWHPVAELPRRPVEVTEYQAHGRPCRGRGTVTWAKIPDEVRAHSYGPQRTALVAYLSGSPHVSKRGLEELIETVVGLPSSLGTVAHWEQELRAALAAAQARARQAVQQAAVQHVEETGWKQAGQRCGRWAAATTWVACVVIHPRRGARGLAALLGQKITGIVCSDRWSVYQRLRTGQRPVCWAHRQPGSATARN